MWYGKFNGKVGGYVSSACLLDMRRQDYTHIVTDYRFYHPINLPHFILLPISALSIIFTGMTPQLIISSPCSWMLFVSYISYLYYSPIAKHWTLKKRIDGFSIFPISGFVYLCSLVGRLVGSTRLYFTTLSLSLPQLTINQSRESVMSDWIADAEIGAGGGFEMRAEARRALYYLLLMK